MVRWSVRGKYGNLTSIPLIQVVSSILSITGYHMFLMLVKHNKFHGTLVMHLSWSYKIAAPKYPDSEDGIVFLTPLIFRCKGIVVVLMKSYKLGNGLP